MKSYLSPGDLAKAIGVSESSLKRWADNGAIGVTRTVGGHRRIARHEALRFIRETNASVLRPRLLGFPEAESTAESPSESLFEALRIGSRDQALGLIQGWFLAGRPLAWIFDGPVADAMERIGRLWKHGPEGILREHRATDLCVKAITQLRLALPPAGREAPSALGGAPNSDPYLLPSLMAAAVMKEAGMRAANLGPQTPLPVLQAAAEEQRAVLVWLSVSTVEGAEAARIALPEMMKALAPLGTHVVIGGRSAHLLEPFGNPQLTFAARMAELAAFAKGLLAGRFT